MSILQKIFPAAGKPPIAMTHVPPLPGTSLYCNEGDRLYELNSGLEGAAVMARVVSECAPGDRPLASTSYGTRSVHWPSRSQPVPTAWNNITYDMFGEMRALGQLAAFSTGRSNIVHRDGGRAAAHGHGGGQTRAPGRARGGHSRCQPGPDLITVELARLGRGPRGRALGERTCLLQVRSDRCRHNGRHSDLEVHAMRWNLRLAAANRGIWKASELQRMLYENGLPISAGKMSGLWSGQPISIKLSDLDVFCTVLGCGVEELLIAEKPDNPPDAFG